MQLRGNVLHLILVPHKLAASCGWALGDSSHSPKTRDIKGGMAAWWFPLFYSMVRVWFGAADNITHENHGQDMQLWALSSWSKTTAKGTTKSQDTNDTAGKHGVDHNKSMDSSTLRGGGLIPLDFKHMTIQVSDKRVGSYRLCSFIPVSLGKVSIQSIRKTTPTIRWQEPTPQHPIHTPEKPLLPPRCGYIERLYVYLDMLR